MTMPIESGASLRGDMPPRLYSLDEALSQVGITEPTYYRWLKAGKMEDMRLRGPRRKAYFTAAAVASLRAMATHVDIVAEDAEDIADLGSGGLV